ncbi:hypothetical protein ABZV60_29130 [Streptomyces sp. NPDC004787]|uniref:hypothetical protein n=1 Tax=Streptomyces sp. NPDC004787 TaxID=3154291 RepID=UPI0033B47834
MRRTSIGTALVLTAVTLGCLTACTSTDSGSEGGPTRAATPAQATKPTPTSPVRIEDGFMPDLVGQSVTSAYGQLSGSMRFEDASGQGRIVPTGDARAEEWKVCTQDPKAGAAVADGQEMVIGAVKNTENC